MTMKKKSQALSLLFLFLSQTMTPMATASEKDAYQLGYRAGFSSGEATCRGGGGGSQGDVVWSLPKSGGGSTTFEKRAGPIFMIRDGQKWFGLTIPRSAFKNSLPKATGPQMPPIKFDLEKGNGTFWFDTNNKDIGKLVKGLKARTGKTPTEWADAISKSEITKMKQGYIPKQQLDLPTQ